MVILTSLAPFIVFWVLMYLGREELGFKGVAISGRRSSIEAIPLGFLSEIAL
jgi:hypothetical protein